jgi:hypothetical protein
MRLKMCLGVKHTLTNEGECKEWSPMTPKCTHTLRVALVWELQMFRALIEKTKKHQIGPQDTIRKVLKRRCLKCPCIVVHLNQICLSYDQKKGWESNWEFYFQSQILWKQGSNEIWLGHVIHYCKDIFEGYKFVLRKLWTSKVLGQQVLIGSPEEKWHLDVIPTKRHKLYYREGSGASSQRLRAV